MNFQSPLSSRKRSRQAMSLLELVGVLAIMAILASLLLPALLKQIDKATADQEIANLQAFSDAMQRSVMRNRYIPGAVDWATNIAAELGWNVLDVQNNPRRNQRYFLIDPVFASSVTLPYSQGLFGLTNQPSSARVILLSSLGQPLPAMNNGVPAFPGDFSNIWNSVDGRVPFATLFSGWRGSGADLMIKRVNLSQLFSRLLLTCFASTNYCYYSIDNNLNPYTLTSSNWIDGYFIQNSVFGLYSGATNNIDSQQILIRDSSFVYYQNGWRSPLTDGSTVSGSLTNGGAFDFSTIVNCFLAAPGNIDPRATTQQQVVQAFINFMQAYNTWASFGCPHSSTDPNYASYTAAQAYQLVMVNTVSNLYNPVPPQIYH